MNWLNLPISVARSPEFIGAEPAQRSTWFSLLAYCAEQENGGVIVECNAWKDRRWQQTAAVTAAEVGDTCELYWFNGTDLHIAFYPTTKETQVKAGRSGGTSGGRPRKKPPEIPAVNPLENPVADPLSDKGETLSETLDDGKGKAPPKPEEKIREEKIREEREKSAPAPLPPIDEWSDVMPTANAKRTDQIMAWINSMNPSWKRRPAFTRAEQEELLGIMRLVSELTDTDWRTLRAYMHAIIPADWGKFWQPDTRSRFMQACSDLLAYSDKWAAECRRRRIPIDLGGEQP